MLVRHSSTVLLVPSKYIKAFNILIIVIRHLFETLPRILCFCEREHQSRTPKILFIFEPAHNYFSFSKKYTRLLNFPSPQGLTSLSLSLSLCQPTLQCQLFILLRPPLTGTIQPRVEFDTCAVFTCQHVGRRNGTLTSPFIRVTALRKHAKLKLVEYRQEVRLTKHSI